MKAHCNLLSNEGGGKKNRETENGNPEKMPELLICKEVESLTNIKKKTGDLKTNPFNLTKKEIAILDSLSKGHSYKMIAEDCSVATNTVREHIRNIYHKLNVHSSVEAVILALKKKLFCLFFLPFCSHDYAIDAAFSLQYLYS